jgi:hypothetical protein
MRIVTLFSDQTRAHRISPDVLRDRLDRFFSAQSVIEEASLPEPLTFIPMVAAKLVRSQLLEASNELKQAVPC